MKLKENNIESYFSGKNLDFSIDDNSKNIIFDVLMKKMYRDPIGTVVREVASNARDAHREAGRAHIPIDIEFSGSGLWSNNTPSLIIRDHGPGISPDRMENVFSKFGASTKRTANDQTGGFGLGAKSPFSYTNRFGIISSHGGKKRIYSAIVDSKNNGTIVSMGEEDTTETGVEIIVPLKSPDIRRFEEMAYKWTLGWDPLPNFIGFESTRSKELLKLNFDDGVSIVVHDKPVSSEKIIVMSDGIPYDLNRNEFSEKEGEWLQFNRCYSSYNSGGLTGHRAVILNFGIGELTMSAGREGLHLDDDTRTAIVEKAKKAYSHFINDAIEYLEKNKSKSKIEYELAKTNLTANSLSAAFASTHPDGVKQLNLANRSDKYTLTSLVYGFNSLNGINSEEAKKFTSDISLMRHYYLHNNNKKSNSMKTNNNRGQINIDYFIENRTVYYTLLRTNPIASIQAKLWEDNSNNKGFYVLYGTTPEAVRILSDIGLNMVNYANLPKLKKLKMGRKNQPRQFNCYVYDLDRASHKNYFSTKNVLQVDSGGVITNKTMYNYANLIPNKSIAVVSIADLDFRKYSFRIPREYEEIIGSLSMAMKIKNETGWSIIFVREKEYTANKKAINANFKLINYVKIIDDLKEKNMKLIADWRLLREVQANVPSNSYTKEHLNSQDLRTYITLMYKVLEEKDENISKSKKYFQEKIDTINLYDSDMISFFENTKYDKNELYEKYLEDDTKKLLVTNNKITELKKDVLYFRLMLRDAFENIINLERDDKMLIDKHVKHIHEYLKCIKKIKEEK